MQYPILQALKATSLEKSIFLRKEHDTWAAYENEKASREAAEGELGKECKISAELRQKCSDLMTEAREAREKVAPLEKRVSNLTLESQEQRAAAEGYRGEVARLEALLAEKDLSRSCPVEVLRCRGSEPLDSRGHGRLGMRGARGISGCIGVIAAEPYRGSVLPGQGEDEGGTPRRDKESPGGGELSLRRHRFAGGL